MGTEHKNRPPAAESRPKISLPKPGEPGFEEGFKGAGERHRRFMERNSGLEDEMDAQYGLLHPDSNEEKKD